MINDGDNNGGPPDVPEEPNGAAQPDEQPEPSFNERIGEIVLEHIRNEIMPMLSEAVTQIKATVPSTDAVAQQVIAAMAAKGAQVPTNGVADARATLEAAGAEVKPSPAPTAAPGPAGSVIDMGIAAAKADPIAALTLVLEKGFEAFDKIANMRQSGKNPIEVGRAFAAKYPELAPLLFPDAMDAQIPFMVGQAATKSFSSGFSAGLKAGQESGAGGGGPVVHNPFGSDSEPTAPEPSDKEIWTGEPDPEPEPATVAMQRPTRRSTGEGRRVAMKPMASFVR